MSGRHAGLPRELTRFRGGQIPRGYARVSRETRREGMPASDLPGIRAIVNKLCQYIWDVQSTRDIDRRSATEGTEHDRMRLARISSLAVAVGN